MCSSDLPFFSLEQQAFADVVPDLNGLDILDAGCGTGRLFQYFKERGVNRIVGVDSSIEMVRHATARGLADVRNGSCDALPLPDSEYPIAIASFVLSYVADLRAAASELMRVCQPGAVLIVSDMHPETAQRFGWRRTFRDKNESVRVPWFCQIGRAHV